MTIPGQVSSGSTAHQSRPSTFTGRTRTGRLRSPRLASKDECFRSAFFTAIPSLLYYDKTHIAFPSWVFSRANTCFICEVRTNTKGAPDMDAKELFSRCSQMKEPINA